MKRIRFWMTFGDAYINHLTVLKNVGMIGIEPIEYQGQQIIPLQFLAAVLPKPETLGPTTKGKTNIGDIATGEALDGSGEKKNIEARVPPAIQEKINHPIEVKFAPFRGEKGTTWEGGVRVPCVIRWPGRRKSEDSPRLCMHSGMRSMDARLARSALRPGAPVPS